VATDCVRLGCADVVNGSVVIPAYQTSIADSAFGGCSALTNVTFASGSQLLSIGSHAFGKTGLTSIAIPASVTSIGDYAL
jgi:hypothetical protein